MDSYTRFLPKTQPYLNSSTRTPKFVPYIITLRQNKLSQYIGVECTLSYHFAEVYAALLLSLINVPNNITLLR